MKILIRGAGFQNKGAKAMLRVAQQELSRRIPHANFYATVTPSEAHYAYRSGIVPIYYQTSTRMKILQTLPFGPQIPRFVLSKKNPDFARAIKIDSLMANEINRIESVDVVIDVSGFAYGDLFGTTNLRRTFAWIDYCHSKQKPYIFLPQAWSSFEKEEVAYWGSKVFKGSSLLFSRDEESTKYLTKVQEMSEFEIRQALDTVFCYQGANKAAGHQILKELGINNERPLIGLVPNMQVYRRTSGYGPANEYIKLLIDLANHLIEDLNFDVLLAPNEIKVPGDPTLDDRFLCSTIETHIQKREHCFKLHEYYPSETIKSILGNLDLLIASRYHSLVFALSQGVPVLPLGWSHKYVELLRSFGLEEFVVDHDRLNRSEVMSIVASAWQQRETIREKISKTVPRLQKKVQDLFDEVGAMIGDKSYLPGQTR